MWCGKSGHYKESTPFIGRRTLGSRNQARTEDFSANCISKFRGSRPLSLPEIYGETEAVKVS